MELVVFLLLHWRSARYHFGQSAVVVVTFCLEGFVYPEPSSSSSWYSDKHSA
jgi:hypothetical protein